MKTLPSPLMLLAATACVLLPGCPGDDSGDDASGPTTGASTTSSTSAEGSTGGSGSTSDGEGSTGGGSTTEGDATDATDATTEGDSTGSTGEAGLEIAGEWFEDFGDGTGVDHLITDVRWDQFSGFGDAAFHIESYDNEARWVVAQGDAANEFFPGLYSRFDWTWDGADLYYCTAVFDAATAADAEAAPDPDPGDLAMGCMGFPWSLLIPPG